MQQKSLCWDALKVLMMASMVLATGSQAQTWQYLGARYCVNNAKDMSIGYNGTTRVLYIAAKSDSVLRAEGSNIVWSNKPFASPDLVTCESGNPNVVYTGINGSGIWRSNDGGANWSSSGNGLSNARVVRLGISPHNANRLFVGAHGQQSNAPTDFILFESQNGGGAWFSVPAFEPLQGTVQRIVFDPTNPSYIWVAGTTFGVRRSDDGGGTWFAKNSGLDVLDILSLAIAPQSPSTLFAGTVSGSTRIYKTTNRGDNWTVFYSASGVLINDIKVDPFSPANALVVYAATSEGVLKSTTGGATWAARNTGIIDLDVHAIAVDPQAPANRVYAATRTTFYVSVNGGDTWTDAADGAEVLSVGGIAVYNDDMYYVTGKSLPILSTRRLAGSATWDYLSQQSAGSPDYFVAKDLAIDYSNPTLLNAAGKFTSSTGGAPQSYGAKTISSTDAGEHWLVRYQPTWSVPIAEHSANAIVVDPNLSSKVFAATHWNTVISPPQFVVPPLAYSGDGGKTWGFPVYYILDDLFTIAVDKTSGTPGTQSLIAYAAGGIAQDVRPIILKTTDGGQNWFESNNGVPEYQSIIVRSLVTDPTNGSTVYAGTSFGGILKSTDAGSNWQSLPIANPLIPNTWPVLVHHPNRSGCVYGVRLASNGSGTVMQTLDAGSTWTSISTGIQSTPINHLAFKSNTSSTYPRYLFAGTDLGVYRIDFAPFAPQNVQVANYRPNPPVNGNPRVTWTTNPEPDLPTNPYRVYRKIVQVGGPVFQDWTLIATVSGTSYVDYDIGIIPKDYPYLVYYKMTTVDLAGTASPFSNEVSIYATSLNWKVGDGTATVKPASFALHQNTPNPFNPSTQIKFDLPEDGYVLLNVFDVLGRKVGAIANGNYAAGYHSVIWNASAIASGVYFARFTATDEFGKLKFSKMSKLILSK